MYGSHIHTATGALPQVPCALLCCAFGDVPEAALRPSITPISLNTLTKVDSDCPKLLPKAAELLCFSGSKAPRGYVCTQTRLSEGDHDDVVMQDLLLCKLSAKEQDAARYTHASPSHDLKAGNGVPNDADQLKNSQKLTSPDPKVVASAVALHHFLAALLQPVCTALL